jgi:diaminopimelate epimerase
MTWRLPFVKMHGAGNDFIMVSSRDVQGAGLNRAAIAALCDRRTGVGADGLIIVHPADRADFGMSYYNADGGEAEMCGNGARCAVAFAQDLGLAGATCRFASATGSVEGRRAGKNVSVGLPGWRDLQLHCPLDDSPFPAHHYVNTGVPHLVVPVPDPAAVDLPIWGPRLRSHAALAPAGANIDWVQSEPQDGAFALRTFERGVEAETLACGTGAAAVAVVLVKLDLAVSPVALLTHGGDRLTVSLDIDDPLGGLVLTGPAVVVFKGEVEIHE